MLNTHKLLYILPDLSYITELLPAKKQHTFAVQSFRQINGTFLDENELNETNIEKLFSKLDKETYHLILPDLLFTNTIVSVEGTTKSDVLEHVEKNLLPNLKLTPQTHIIQTTVLNSFKGNSKVQISAIEKSVLAPIYNASQSSGLEIEAVSPLSWTMKSVISLEPSISIFQVGSNLYVAQHYIGVDQTSSFEIDDYDAVGETIKTLKGSEPSIQSVYLVSSALVEENIKEKLSDTIPIQQLASFKEDDSQMPSYIKFIIESSMRTLSIPDYPVPNFDVAEAEGAESATTVDAELSDESTDNTKDDSAEDEEELPDLPTPSAPESAKPETENETESASEDLKEVETSSESLDTELEKESEKTEEVKTASTDSVAAVTEVAANAATATAIEETEPTMPDKKSTVEITTPEEDSTKEVVVETPKPEEKAQEVAKVAESEPQKDEVKTAVAEPAKPIAETKPESDVKTKDAETVDLQQFAIHEEDEGNGLAVESPTKPATPTASTATAPVAAPTVKKQVIKNSSGVSNMLKMVFITVAVFFITIAIGVGVGLGLLKMSDSQPAESTPEVITETPTPEPTAEPTPEPVEINKSELSILVVNATTKAGYAGQIGDLLEAAEIEDVSAANAKGDYEQGTNYLLMLEENTALEELLEDATDLQFEYSDEIATEDPEEKYDAVIVLAD